MFEIGVWLGLLRDDGCLFFHQLSFCPLAMEHFLGVIEIQRRHPILQIVVFGLFSLLLFRHSNVDCGHQVALVDSFPSIDSLYACSGRIDRHPSLEGALCFGYGHHAVDVGFAKDVEQLLILTLLLQRNRVLSHYHDLKKKIPREMSTSSSHPHPHPHSLPF